MMRYMCTKTLILFDSYRLQPSLLHQSAFGPSSLRILTFFEKILTTMLSRASHLICFPSPSGESAFPHIYNTRFSTHRI
jgi:hypothetical protein